MYVKKEKTLTGILLQRPQQVLESISKTGTIWIIIIFSRNVSIQLPERPPLPFKAALVHQSSHQSNILRGENVFFGTDQAKENDPSQLPMDMPSRQSIGWGDMPNELNHRTERGYPQKHLQIPKKLKNITNIKKSDKIPTNTIKISKTHKNQKFLSCPENQVKAKCRRQVFNIKFEKMHFQWNKFLK